MREAQGFCDQLAQRLVRKAGLELEDEAPAGGEAGCCVCARGGGWRVALTVTIAVVTPPLPPLPAARAKSGLPARLQQVNSEAVYAVLQSLGRFMASYFTSRPLAIMPPHCVDVLPPLHLPPGGSGFRPLPGLHVCYTFVCSLPACVRVCAALGQRLVPLSQISVTEAVRTQELSGVWTVGYALDLLLLGGLLPEAAWFARRLGDWKTAVSLGVAYTAYCRDEPRLTG